MNEFDEILLRDRAKRRFEELQFQPEKLLQRFDENNDGKLNALERQAALITLRQEILAEKNELVDAGSEKFQLEETIEDRYRVLSEIGVGTQSNVYIARDLSNNALVVLKQMRVSRLDSWEAFDAFQREARILKDFDHPKIPTMIDSFAYEREEEVTFVSVQSYLVGDNLEHLVKEGRLFVEAELISIARQCLELLAVLHSNSPVILHRDIKPSNLLLNEADGLSLIDFGVVQYATESKTLAMGTAGYMAPEQLVGRAIPQSDLYSLGVCLIRLATRKKPEDFELRRSRLQWRKSASLSKGFSNWIDRLIDPESEDRFSSAVEADQFLDKLNKVAVIQEEKKRVKNNLTELEEITNVLKNPNFRIWRSPDLLVCTVGSPVNTGFLTRLEIARLRFSTGSYRVAFEKYGSGFSLTADSVLELRCGGWRVARSKISVLSNGVYFNGRRSLFGEFGEPILAELKEEEINHIWIILLEFCDSNGMKISTKTTVDFGATMKLKKGDAELSIKSSSNYLSCTFGRKKEVGFWGRSHIFLICNVMGSFRKAFEIYGGEFSLDDVGLLEVSCGGIKLFRTYETQVSKSSYADGALALFDKKHGPITGVLTRKELDRIWQAFESFRELKR